LECGEYFADKIKYDGCPIENEVEAYGCNGTPYEEYEALVNDEGVYDIELAQEQLAFLESLKGE